MAEKLVDEKSLVFHHLSVDSTFEILKSTKKGLTREEVIERRKKYGNNELETQKQRSRVKMLLDQFINPITYVLLAAALISLIVGKLTNVIVILAIIILNGLIGFIQEAKAEQALESLKNMAAPETTILRDCGEKLGCTQFRIKSSEIVPGDIIFLEAGDKIPADARLFEIANLQVDEAILTGESLPVRKTIDSLSQDLAIADRKNLVYSGTNVLSGRAKAIIYATGMHTEIGKIAQLINQTDVSKSPLEKKVAKLSKSLGILAFIASILTFGMGILRGFDVLEMLVFSTATLVSSIPSGLPATITITLAIGVSRMVKRNAIIRKLNAIDSLGAITAIVSDKTGTLTQNQMTVRKIYVNEQDIDVSGIGYKPEGIFSIKGKPIDFSVSNHLNKLLEGAVLCNDSTLREHEQDDRSYEWEIVGDPTEGSLMVAGLKQGLNKEELNRQYPRKDEIPFDSKNKYMVTIHEDEKHDRVRLFIKGAPEIILNYSFYYYNNDKILEISHEQRKTYLNRAESYASNGYRVLGLATIDIDRDNTRLDEIKHNFENGDLKLIFLGFVGIIDPPREEVKEAIQIAKKAGIKVFMATGDHKLTATAIGNDIGLIEQNQESMAGMELDTLSDQGLSEKIETTRIFARVSPEHKYRIVTSLKEKGEIVAMTGDGANDAPALKASDVGVAMGITGTDVTKDAGSMILTDDNFASIVNAVEEGRVVYENIKKGIKFLLTTNMGEVITFLLSMLLINTNALIFTPIMILWVNLVTDGSLTVALASEPKEGDVMSLPPKKPDEKIIDKTVLLNISLTASIMAGGVLFVFLVYGKNESLIYRETLSFTTLAILQIFNAIASRSRRESIFTIGFKENKTIVYGLIVSFGLQILAVHLPFFNLILETTPMKVIDWVIILAIGSTILIADEIRKLILRKH